MFFTKQKTWNEMFLVFVGVSPGFTGSHHTLKNSAAIIWGDFWGWFSKGFRSKWSTFGFGVA